MPSKRPTHETVLRTVYEETSAKTRVKSVVSANSSAA